MCLLNRTLLGNGRLCGQESETLSWLLLVLKFAWYKLISAEETTAQSPTLFLCSFPELSDTVRLDFAAGGADSYVEIDSVLLIGASAVSVAKLNSSNVYYKQDPDSDYYHTGDDFFNFTIDDANLYMAYQGSGTSSASITLDITPVNDAPKVRPETVEFNGTEVAFSLSVTDPDGPELFVHLKSPPLRGKIRVLSHSEDLKENDEVSCDCFRFFTSKIPVNSTLLYYSSKCGNFEDEFTISATDGLLTSFGQVSIIAYSPECYTSTSNVCFNLTVKDLASIIVPLAVGIPLIIVVIVGVFLWVRSNRLKRQVYNCVL